MGDRDHAGSASIDDRPTESELALAVVASRESADALAELAAPAIDPPLEAVLQDCRVALDALATQHARLADESDLDIEADTRWAARWQLAGAALAYANALVDLSDRGYVDPALPMSRALYESLGMLGVINDDAEHTILDRWLADRNVQPKKIRGGRRTLSRAYCHRSCGSGR